MSIVRKLSSFILVLAIALELVLVVMVRPAQAQANLDNGLARTPIWAGIPTMALAATLMSRQS